MRLPTIDAGIGTARSGTLLLACAASLAGALFAAPALAAPDRDHDRRAAHGERGRGHDERRHFHYRQPVYVPPPLYYDRDRRESAGIQLFFPLDLHR